MDWNSAPTDKTRATESVARAEERRARQARAVARHRGRARLGAVVLVLVAVLAGGWAIASALGSHGGDGAARSAPPATPTAATGGDVLQNEATAAADAYVKAQPKPSDWELSPVVLGAIPADAAVRQATTASKVVALTFDDGPSEYTAQLVAELKDLGVPATFFVIGRQIEDFPDVVAQENRFGNVVGNHTWGHVDLARQKKKLLRSQVSDTSTAIFRATGRWPTLLRPPYGSTSRKVNTYLRSRRLVATLWDVDSEDWRGIPTPQIVRNVVSGVQPGSIVLLHDGGGSRNATLAAVPLLVARLRGEGYTFRTVPALLDAGPPAASSSSFYMGGD
jgi:peptidoglycan/xylan/chitin deacetylase (PgdA/CDA1 family)